MSVSATLPFSRTSLVLALALGLLTGASLAWLAIASDLAEAEREFHLSMEDIDGQIAYRTTAAEAVLLSLAGLHHASDSFPDHELAILAANVSDAYSFIDSILFVEAVPRERRDTFERALRNDGFPQYRIWRHDGAGGRVASVEAARFYPVRSAYPLTPRLAARLGHDIASDDILWPPARNAMRTGTVQPSRPLTLASGGRGYAVFKAVYLGHVVPDTDASRQTHSSGFIVLNVSTDRVESRTLDARIHWQLATADGGELLMSRSGEEESILGSILPPLLQQDAIDLHGVPHQFMARRDIYLDDIRVPAVVMLFLLPFMVIFSLLSVVAMQYSRRQAMAAANRRLRESEERFRDFAEVASDWLWQADEHLTISALVNGRPETHVDSGQRLVGANLAALGDGAVGDAAAADDGEARRTFLRNLEARAPFRDYRYCLADAAGREEWWSINGKPIQGPGGAFIGYRGTGRAVTVEMEAIRALEAARDLAEQANEAKSEFLAHMSHELLTPLNAILGFSEAMAQQILGDLGSKTYVEYAQAVHASGSHLLQVLNDLLDLSRIEAGRLDLEEEEVELDDLMEACLRMVSGRAREHDHEVAVAQNGSMRIWADARKLRQVLLNLLSNAIKFTPDGGRIDVSAWRQEDGDICLAVRDRGIGMAPAQLPLALEPFRQLEDRYVRSYDGTGLGLPLSKGLVELHGGTLVLESTVGEGTTVFVRLPGERLLSQPATAEQQVMF